jgi:ABC-type iron transport system FetAB permease component
MMGRVSETTNAPSQRRLTLSSVLPVWALAVVGAVLVLVFASKDAFAWLLLVFVASVFVSFALQLATRTKDGLVERISIASTGSFVVVLVTSVVLLVSR